MALLYHYSKTMMETKEVVIRKLEDDDDYKIAITFPGEDDDDENEVTELLLTVEEVKEAADLVFNN